MSESLGCGRKCGRLRAKVCLGSTAIQLPSDLGTTKCTFY